MKTPSTDFPLPDESSIQNESLPILEIVQRKKKKRLNTLKYKSGRWDVSEHKLFLELFMKYKKNWKKVNFLNNFKIESFMYRRTAEQIRSHSQKYVIKLLKKYSIKKVLLISIL